MVRTGKIVRRHCSALARNTFYKGDMKQRRDILTRVSMGDASPFVIKGDVPTFMMGNRMEDAPALMIKGDAS
jgi:hypothetical protein